MQKSFLINLLILLTLTGCSTFTKKGTWGKDALWPISSEKVWRSFKKNITSSHVWIPLAGAGVSFWGGFDRKISHWASDKTPVYGSQKDAHEWSDDLDNVLLYEMYATPLLTSSNSDGTLKTYAFSKFKGYMVTSVASQASDLTRDSLASDFRRQRPNKKDYRSFPSGHSNQAGSRNALVSRNLDSIPMNEGLRTSIKTLNTTMAAGVMWGRLEAKKHYPSDVLTGYALGSFISGFIYDSLMNVDSERPETFAVIPGPDKVSLNYSYIF